MSGQVQMEDRDSKGRFLASHSAGGRPVGSRSRFGDQFYLDMAASWQRHGASVMDAVAEKDPSTYLRVAASVIPKELTVAFSATLPAGLDAADWSAIVGVARAVKERVALKDLKPEQACDYVARALSAYDAVTVIDAST